MALTTKHTVALSILELWKRMQLLDDFKLPETEAEKRRLWFEFLNEFECIDVIDGIRKFFHTLRNVTSRNLLRFLESEDSDSIALFIKEYISLEHSLFINVGGMGPCTRERDAERLRNMTRPVGIIAEETVRPEDAKKISLPSPRFRFSGSLEAALVRKERVDFHKTHLPLAHGTIHESEIDFFGIPSKGIHIIGAAKAAICIVELYIPTYRISGGHGKDELYTERTFVCHVPFPKDIRYTNAVIECKLRRLETFNSNSPSAKLCPARLIVRTAAKDFDSVHEGRSIIYCLTKNVCPRLVELFKPELMSDTPSIGFQYEKNRPENLPPEFSQFYKTRESEFSVRLNHIHVNRAVTNKVLPTRVQRPFELVRLYEEYCSHLVGVSKSATDITKIASFANWTLSSGFEKYHQLIGDHQEFLRFYRRNKTTRQAHN